MTTCLLWNWYKFCSVLPRKLTLKCFSSVPASSLSLFLPFPNIYIFFLHNKNCIFMDVPICLKLVLGINPGCHYFLLFGCFVSLIGYSIFHAFSYNGMLDLITSSLGVLSLLISQRFIGRNNEANQGLTAHRGKLGRNISFLPCITSRSEGIPYILQVQTDGQCQAFSEIHGSVEKQMKYLSLPALPCSFQYMYLPFAHRSGTES